MTSVTTSMGQILIADLRPVGRKRSHTVVVAVGNLQ